MRRTLSREQYEREPHEAWNAFVDLVMISDYEQLTPLQRAGHLLMWYDSEVRNGGHLQYFANRGVSHLTETLQALETIGASCQRQILQEAAELRQGRPILRIPIISLKIYVNTARAGQYDSLDTRYYGCAPKLTDLLETHLQTHFDEFIDLV